MASTQSDNERIAQVLRDLAGMSLTVTLEAQYRFITLISRLDPNVIFLPAVANWCEMNIEFIELTVHNKL